MIEKILSILLLLYNIDIFVISLNNIDVELTILINFGAS